MEKTNCDNFKERLEALQDFPCVYPFKFIVPAEQVADAIALFPKGTTSLRQSRTGKYISVSADIHVNTADEVLQVYGKARSIKGVMAL